MAVVEISLGQYGYMDSGAGTALAVGRRVFTSGGGGGGGGGAIEPPKTGGGVQEKGSIDRHHYNY